MIGAQPWESFGVDPHLLWYGISVNMVISEDPSTSKYWLYLHLKIQDTSLYLLYALWSLSPSSLSLLSLSLFSSDLDLLFYDKRTQKEGNYNNYIYQYLWPVILFSSFHFLSLISFFNSIIKLVTGTHLQCTNTCLYTIHFYFHFFFVFFFTNKRQNLPKKKNKLIKARISLMSWIV